MLRCDCATPIRETLLYFMIHLMNRGCASDLPPDMLKPATNQAFGSKSSLWQQVNKTKKNKKHQQLFPEDSLYFWRQNKFKKNSWRQITFCRKRRFQHIRQQITGTPSMMIIRYIGLRLAESSRGQTPEMAPTRFLVLDASLLIIGPHHISLIDLRPTKVVSS